MDDRRIAVAFMVGSAVAFSLMGVCVKSIPEVPIWHKVVLRNLITLGIALVVLLSNGRPLLGHPGNRIFLLLRSVLGIGGVACYFYAIDHLLLADAVMLNMLSPFVVALLAAMLLGERSSPTLVVALTLAFAGGLLIIKPRLDLSVVPALVGLASAVFAGGAYAVLRFLRDREAPETIIFVFSLATVVGLGPVACSQPRIPSPSEIAWLLGIGLTAGAGQFCLTAAYRWAPATEVTLYGYSRIIISALLGLLIFAEVPDLASILGGVLILVGGTTTFLRRHSRPAEPPENGRCKTA